MSASSSSAHCPHCGTPLSAGVPSGQCPRCLMAQAMEPTQPDGGRAALPLAPEQLAPHFPQLEILECLGRGGMGVVYKARQKSLNRLVALKLLAPERVGDPQFAARFEKEAQALAALNHPHIVAVHDFGKVEGSDASQLSTLNSQLFYLLMEFVDGVNLRQLLQTKRLTPKEALSIVPPVCDALQCAHDHGIVHRDIKPENLLIDKAGVVKIADFGIAKMLGDGTHGADAGTPAYAAPEQSNGTADHRADIYSLGVVLYEMLTGERPKEDITPPSKRVQVDIRIDEIVLKALEKTPELRFATAAEFRTQVESLDQPASPPGGNHTIAAGGGPSRSVSAAADTRLPKTGRATLVTPEELATARGQFFCYRTRGTLVLDETSLTHSSYTGGTTIIPLRSIRDLSIGRLPRSMNLAGLEVLSLTYEDEAAGQSRHVLISPLQVGFRHSWQGVAEWFAAIRAAAVAATGRAPAMTPAAQLGIPRSSRLLVVLVFILALLLAGLIGFAVLHKVWSATRVSIHQVTRAASFPTGAHISRNHHSVLVTHDQAATALHHVLYSAGYSSATSAGSQNLAANTWVDEGTVKLRNGRAFGYRREALYPDELHINGTAYDLREGRVLFLRDDGTVAQFRLFPLLAEARDPEAVARLIAAEEVEDRKRGIMAYAITQVEVPPGTHDIVVHLRRSGLNEGRLDIETRLDVTASRDPTPRMPKNGPWTMATVKRVQRAETLRLTWTLPDEISPQRLHETASGIMARFESVSEERSSRRTLILQHGGPVKLAGIRHADGWECHLFIRTVKPGELEDPSEALPADASQASDPQKK